MYEFNGTNFTNLRLYWQAMGTTELTHPFKMSTDWPNRLWSHEPDYSLSEAVSILAREPRSLIFPVAGSQFNDELSNKGAIEVRLEQVAMNLDLKDRAPSEPAIYSRHLQVIESPQMLATWIEICSSAFAYTIDAVSIQKLMRNDDARVYLLTDQGVAKATAITFRTGNTLGVHQVGVPEQFRRQGLAQSLMQHIIAQAYDNDIETVVLQASKMGQPLYQSFGFTDQFHINYIAVD
ncbi:GNAT family N-acetyltransferase [Gilvimarinus sp. SDUM040013]|uniref:GNAT family N-acetyltransferase n=1 Tax=Gilvimarinus gilvus TaxID=3058038 RepID=A0ABU4RX84_9GAMM|nr:GNAT family N-acetyltransferase [Gilvimarinus sp. SDUM040013]MDO3386635.1 GNAT family N-acetyltransferase [Gilvimarinus sp. SDUM040013]MDX6849478.1 GNAT family N-acetyltransferase [Gilvimarinus sp. SDUM040013]